MKTQKPLAVCAGGPVVLYWGLPRALIALAKRPVGVTALTGYCFVCE
jgi:hypothetical protein